MNTDALGYMPPGSQVNVNNPLTNQSPTSTGVNVLDNGVSNDSDVIADTNQAPKAETNFRTLDESREIITNEYSTKYGEAIKLTASQIESRVNRDIDVMMRSDPDRKIDEATMRQVVGGVIKRHVDARHSAAQRKINEKELSSVGNLPSREMAWQTRRQNQIDAFKQVSTEIGNESREYRKAKKEEAQRAETMITLNSPASSVEKLQDVAGQQENDDKFHTEATVDTEIKGEEGLPEQNMTYTAIQALGSIAGETGATDLAEQQSDGDSTVESRPWEIRPKQTIAEINAAVSVPTTREERLAARAELLSNANPEQLLAEVSSLTSSDLAEGAMDDWRDAIIAALGENPNLNPYLQG